ncbi:SDR family oxidoreductase [Botryobacter ruber]|uniref:SDR family oxidoreductase n=1 Tax=Botryobacter ruber TaxID=2171629 RepID=UPI000E0B0031|nr:SDR family oxidoreductase [Botryobacter ruber]
MKIGITGATGQLGKLVVTKLKGKVAPENIVALVRTPAKAEILGVEVRKTDYTKPETLVHALQGIETLLLISSSEVGQRATQHKNVLIAARQANVNHIVYTSLLHADTSTLSLADEHRATEALLKETGIPYTILRNGWYTENYTGSIQGALAGGAFIGSAGNGKISSASRADFADAAVAVLLGEEHNGKVYELAGDDAYTLHDLAAEISRQTGKDLSYKNLPEEEYADALSGFGLPEGLAQAIAGWDVAASQGALYDDSRQLSKLIGHPTTPLAKTVKEALNANQ